MSTQQPADDVRPAPKHLKGILLHLGPGMILAGSIVGSGELIATTRTGAEANFSFLWLILLGCIVKVFTQIELARYAISSGKTTLAMLNEVPGPRVRGGNGILWFWFLMFVATLAQQRMRRAVSYWLNKKVERLSTWKVRLGTKSAEIDINNQEVWKAKTAAERPGGGGAAASTL